MIIIGFGPDSIRAAGKKLIYYGKYSYLVFSMGRILIKGYGRQKRVL
ncbi:MAG: hypothetical protein AABZ11_07285 [Nitrospinota bacterium]